MLVDSFGRTLTYVRLSVTDRCDFRCVYCMSEDMQFLPKAQLLTFEEQTQIATAFVALGVKHLRITGGEPLIRRNLMQLARNLGELKNLGLEELTLTTNGSRLSNYATELKAAGVDRINISLDSLKPDRFKALTRVGDLSQVLKGIDAAVAAGFSRIKLNTVMLRNRNLDELYDLVDFANDKNLDISFIEEMPLGQISEHGREQEFCSSDLLRQKLSQHWNLQPLNVSTSGPSKYWQIKGQTNRIGFISPHSHNFCGSCNRVRLTAEGLLLLCLGNEHSMDLKAIVRRYPGNADKLQETIITAMSIKPEKHEFNLQDNEPKILRFMNATGG